MPLKELSLAEKLRRLRGKEMQKDAARRAGIPPATLCKLERGVRGQSTRPESIAQRKATLERLAQAYGVPLEYLTSDLPTYMRLFAEMAFGRPGLTPGSRLQLVVEELATRYGTEAGELVEILGISERDLEAYMANRLPLAPSLFGRLEQVTGVPAAWIRDGLPGPTNPATLYEKSIALAASAGIPPEELERAVRELLAQRNRD